MIGEFDGDFRWNGAAVGGDGHIYFQRSKDGRNSCLALYQYYLGASSIDNISSAAEEILKLENCKGGSCKWNFEAYVRVRMEQHQILNDPKEHGYAGIDERSKVRHLQDIVILYVL